MQSQSTAARAALVLLLAVTSAPGRVSARDPLEERDLPGAGRQPPDSVFWHCQLPNGGPSIPPRRVGVGRFHLTYLRLDGSNQPTVGTLDCAYDRQVRSSPDWPHSVGVCFSYRLRVGESLPMLDAMYRVTELTLGPNNVRLERVMDKELIKNLTNDRNLIIIPAGAGVRYLFCEDGRQLDDTSILRVLTVTGGGATADRERAHVSLKNATTPNELVLGGSGKETDLSVGDVLPLVKNCRLTVKKIVPPDEKHKILGWVEFSPDPPKEAPTPETAPAKRPPAR